MEDWKKELYLEHGIFDNIRSKVKNISSSIKTNANSSVSNIKKAVGNTTNSIKKKVSDENREWKNHKYIRKDTSRGTIRYIYPEDLKKDKKATSDNKNKLENKIDQNIKKIKNLIDDKTKKKVDKLIDGRRDEPLGMIIPVPTSVLKQVTDFIGDVLNTIKDKIINRPNLKPSWNEFRPEVDTIKPSNDPLKPSDEPLKPSDDPLKPSSEPLKPSDDPLKPSSDPLKPVKYFTLSEILDRSGSKGSLSNKELEAEFSSFWKKIWKDSLENLPIIKTFSELKIKKKSYTRNEDQAAVNPLYGTAYAYSVNCSFCTATYDLRRRGYDVEARPEVGQRGYGGTTVFELLKWWKDSPPLYEIPEYEPKNGKAFTKKEISIIEKEMLESNPNGSRGAFNIFWTNGGGHSVVWEIENNEVILRDCQTGDVETLEDVLLRADKTSYFRTDNLEPSDEILNFVRNCDDKTYEEKYEEGKEKIIKDSTGMDHSQIIHEDDNEIVIRCFMLDGHLENVTYKKVTIDGQTMYVEDHYSTI